jgi:hypothetical protein
MQYINEPQPRIRHGTITRGAINLLFGGSSREFEFDFGGIEEFAFGWEDQSSVIGLAYGCHVGVGESFMIREEFISVFRVGIGSGGDSYCSCSSWWEDLGTTGS